MREQHKADTIHSFKRALSQKEFKVYFQPKIHGKDQTLAGAEALVRWQRDARTIWYPDVFLPILEETWRNPGVGITMCTKKLLSG